MNYRYLGRSGLQVSELSYGAWVSFGTQIGEDQALACMEAAFSAGVNFFDNAEAYADGETKAPEVAARLGPEVLERIEEIVGNRPKGPRALREG